MKVVKDFSSRIINHAVMRLTSMTEDELCFLFAKRQVVFSLKQFTIITGLDCDDLDIRLTKTPSQDHKFKKTYFSIDSKLKIENIKSVFTSTQNIPNEDLVKLVNLCFLEAVLLPRESSALINMEYVSLLDDLSDFYLHPLGTVVLKETIKYFKNAVKNNQTGDNPLPTGYHLGGFSYVIASFIMETILKMADLLSLMGEIVSKMNAVTAYGNPPSDILLVTGYH